MMLTIPSWSSTSTPSTSSVLLISVTFADPAPATAANGSVDLISDATFGPNPAALLVRNVAPRAMVSDSATAPT